MIWVTDGSRFARDLANGVGEAGGTFWWRVSVREEARVSQFDRLADAVAEGFPFPGPVAEVTGTCAELRGFHGRAWQSREGNLHLAAAIPLDRFPAQSAGNLVLAPTLAVRDAIGAATGGLVVPGIKWINDLYDGVGKVGGIVTRTTILGNVADVLVAGVGVNVGSAPHLPPSPFVPRASRVEGASLAAVLRETLAALARRCLEVEGRGRDAMVAEYRSASTAIGRRVRVYDDGVNEELPPSAWPPPLAAGVVRCVGDDLSLVVEGCAEPVTRGRLAFEDECRAFGLPGV